MGGIADILRKSLKTGVYGVQGVYDNTEQVPGPLSETSDPRHTKKMEVSKMSSRKVVDPLSRHHRHQNKKQVSSWTDPGETRNSAISEGIDTLDTMDTSKTHVPEKMGGVLDGTCDIPSLENLPFKPDLTAPFEGPCIVHDPDTCDHPRCIDRRTGTLGNPLTSNGQDIGAFEKDLPHIRLYAWCLANLSVGQTLPMDIDRAAGECRLTAQEVREAIARVIGDGDLEITRSKGGDRFRLRIEYGKAGES